MNEKTYSDNRTIAERPLRIDHQQWKDKNRRLRARGRFSSYDHHRTGTHHFLNETPRKTGFPYRYEEDGEPFYRLNETRRRRSAHFEKYAEEGNRFINEVADVLEIADRHQALRITRAILHAVRDRLPANDAVEFGQGLPMMIKAVYFDQYDISRTPVIIRTAEEFLDFIREKNRFGAIHDFPAPQDVIICLQAIFCVLRNRMDYGQVEQIVKQFPKEIRRLIEEEYTHQI